jgi:hypothetical protein
MRGHRGRTAHVSAVENAAGLLRDVAVLQCCSSRTGRIVALRFSGWYVEVGTIARRGRDIVGCICAILDTLHAVKDAGRVV